MEENTFEDGDSEELEDYEEEPICYHPPQQVAAIAALLETITPEEVQKAFDPEELNREMIYPWCWNRETGKQQGFNEQHLLEDFQSLRDFFVLARQKGDYVLSFVG